MQIRLTLTAAASVLLGTAAFAQTTSLTIGDKAPAFVPEGLVKGAAFTGLPKGKVYVVEFWATWCGPCIASMPHLSEMADKMKGKAEFISVNTWDRNQEGEKRPKDPGHVARVAKFVKENADKMRYNIVLDDEKDTISTTWMRAAGRNGIPCAFIVNKEGQIAWIGHPMQMDKPLESIAAGSWDVAAAKAKFDADAAAAKAQAAARAKAQSAVVAAANAGDLGQFEEAIKGIAPDAASALLMGLSIASRANGAFALRVVEAKIGKVAGVDPLDWCSTLMAIARSVKDEALHQKAAELSAGCIEKADPKSQCLVYTYHAQVLASAGKADEAKAFVVKAKAAVETFEPAAQRPAVLKFIEQSTKAITG